MLAQVKLKHSGNYYWHIVRDESPAHQMHQYVIPGSIIIDTAFSSLRMINECNCEESIPTCHSTSTVCRFIDTIRTVNVIVAVLGWCYACPFISMITLMPYVFTILHPETQNHIVEHYDNLKK